MKVQKKNSTKIKTVQNNVLSKKLWIFTKPLKNDTYVTGHQMKLCKIMQTFQQKNWHIFKKNITRTLQKLIKISLKLTELFQNFLKTSLNYWKYQKININ